MSPLVIYAVDGYLRQFKYRRSYHPSFDEPCAQFLCDYDTIRFNEVGLEMQVQTMTL